MPDYFITFARSARKELEALPANLINRIFLKIEALSVEPRPSGCIKLKGNVSLWRIRIGDYRVIYSINNDTNSVDILSVRHRRDVYR